MLIGNEGNDNLDGGEGDDEYLPGPGDNSITDESGLDVIYLDNNQADVTGLENCNQSECNLSYTSDGSSASLSATGIEVIVFRDSRYNTNN